MNIECMKDELKKARQTGCFRAAFGSIVRRNYDAIKSMSPDERKQLIKDLGMAESYSAELNKELAGVLYDKRLGFLR